MPLCNNEPLGRLIYQTSLKIRNYAEKMLGPHGLTVEQFHILKTTSLEHGLSQNELCSQVAKKPANITRILDRMEKKGWIVRRPNPEDRRSTLVFRTVAGADIEQEVALHFESYSSWFTEGINPDEDRIFREVLSKIDTNIEKLMNEIES